MRAIMSDKLRKIIRDPQGMKELQKGISQLSQGKETKVTIRGHQYNLKFVYAESQDK